MPKAKSPQEQPRTVTGPTLLQGHRDAHEIASCLLGDTWVTTVAMSSRAYGDWRSSGKVTAAVLRMSVPAAALDCLYMDAQCARTGSAP